MRRKIYKKIVVTLLIATVAFLLVSYFVGVKSNQNLATTVNFNNEAEDVEVKKVQVSETQVSEKKQQKESPKELVVNQDLITTSLKVQDQSYTVKIKEGSSAYELMLELKKQGLTFSGSEYSGIGFYVSEINGLVENKKTRAYWTVYINGKQSNLGVSALILKENDTIEWKYETRN
jgi:hypothetical protein